jgi:hypothetical protein
MTNEQRMQSETVGAIQRTATADEILSQITFDLRGLNAGWVELDVDDRNRIVSRWRAKIVSELEAYF